MSKVFNARGFVLALALGVSSLITAPSPAHAFVDVGVSVGVAPPILPVVLQPPIPAEGYIWTPGYWAWGPDGYYWVPGAWVEPPEIGYLWTPAWWGCDDGVYLFHAGYWGPHVGFYGGINYGFGYGGFGYDGGYWHGGHLFYNRGVDNFGSTHITNVYNRTVVNNTNINRTSFNGGRGGTTARPGAAELAAEHEHHIGATATQEHRFNAARTDPATRATESAAHGNIVPQPHERLAGPVNQPGGARSGFREGRNGNGFGVRPAGMAELHVAQPHPAGGNRYTSPAAATRTMSTGAGRSFAPHQPNHNEAYNRPGQRAGFPQAAHLQPQRPAAPAYHPASRPAAAPAQHGGNQGHPANGGRRR